MDDFGATGMGMGGNPYGAITQGVTGIIKGFTEASAAVEQRKRAQQLREQARIQRAEPLEKEFNTALKNSQYQSMYGLPALQTYQNQIDKNIANNIRAIKESSPNGGATLSAISHSLSTANQAQNDLSAKDAMVQQQKVENANKTMWDVGAQKRYLGDLRDKQKQQILQQASALENASTANKQTGINDALGGISQGASQAFRPTYGTPEQRMPQNMDKMDVSSSQSYQLPNTSYNNSLSPYPYSASQQSAPEYQQISPTNSNYNWAIYQ